ncbi:DUF7565 family protein [Halorarum halobium]|uniref:DUF7565 family protein n=1 Tax=Halorarum halobium TaxID=3075121 RepID=UPI0028A83D78|nr:hypothetical protein [Halobaculum sp. XH14]
MPRWACAIDGCGDSFDAVEDAIIHQTERHERHECKVCGTVVPDGYFAIRHAFDEHTRAEFVRSYDADSDAVRKRERVKEEIEDEVDIESVVNRIDTAV